jgi:hypothetical protein
MRLFLVSCSLGVLGVFGCVTSESGLPPCDPNKVYIQTVPATCAPVVTKSTESVTRSCPRVRDIGGPFTNIDKQNKEVARKRCVEIYPASPCLKVFAKMAAYTYRAICGGYDAQGEQHVFDIKDRIK